MLGEVRTWCTSLALTTALGVSGCASVTGQQATIDMEDLRRHPDRSSCPTNQQLNDWEVIADPVKKVENRSRLIDDCVAAIDVKYEEFIRALRRESVGVNLGADLLALGLTTSAALSGDEEAKALAALSTGVAGAGTTIDKDLYYGKTMPALVAAMNANRNTILARIRQSEATDPSYTPSRARRDLRDYAQAGSIDAAITKVTAEANDQEEASLDALHVVYEATTIDAATAARNKKLTLYLWDLSSKNKKDTLDKIAKALGLKTVENIGDERAAIVANINYRLSTAKGDKAAALDGVVKKIQQALPGEKLPL